MRRKLGAHADVSDQGLLALTGANGIGRVRVVPRGVSVDAPASNLDMVSLLAATGSRDNLLRQLEAGITEGVSGVMPKMLARPEDKATVWTDEFILKTGPADLPGLSVNEFLCLEVARHAGLEVPETQLSEDGQVLAIRRFDRLANGAAWRSKISAHSRGWIPSISTRAASRTWPNCRRFTSVPRIARTAQGGCLRCCS